MIWSRLPGAGCLVGGEVGVEVFGCLGDGAVDAAGGFVGGEGEGAAFAAVPGFQEGVGHQGQGAGFAVDFVDDAGGQGAFDDEARGLGGFDDGLAEFVAVHGRDQKGGLA